MSGNPKIEEIGGDGDDMPELEEDFSAPTGGADAPVRRRNHFIFPLFDLVAEETPLTLQKVCQPSDQKRH